jgi:hypothetical protein
MMMMKMTLTSLHNVVCAKYMEQAAKKAARTKGAY